MARAIVMFLGYSSPHVCRILLMKNIFFEKKKITLLVDINVRNTNLIKPNF